MELSLGELTWFLAAAAAPLVALAVWWAANGVLPRRRAYKRGSGLYLPAADETAVSVERFRQAARRFELVEFVWERYARGRAPLS